MLGDSSWLGAGFIYAGFGILVIDAFLEPRLVRWWKAASIFLIAILASVFSWYFVFFNAPIEVVAIITDAAYPAGTKIAGISFKPDFTELRLVIRNPTNRDYHNLDLNIQPSVPIAAIAQQTTMPGVTFRDKDALSFRMIDFNRAAGKGIAVPIELLATDAGYTMRCDKLSAYDEITVVVALADLKWNPSPEPPQRSPAEAVRDKDYVMRIRMSDATSYWVGHPDGDVYAPRPTTNLVTIDGKYRAGRERHISEKIEVAGEIGPIR